MWVEFEWGTDIRNARQIVSEKISGVTGDLPPEGERPTLAPQSSIMGEIFFLSLSSEQHSPAELRSYAEVSLRRRLLAVPGVSQATPIGGGEKQFQVVVNPAALQAHNVTLNQVIRALEEGNENVSAGIINERSAEWLVTGVGRIHSLDDIGATVVAAQNGVPTLVRDLGEVKVGEAQKRGEGSAMGRPAVIVGIQKQPGANTLKLTKRSLLSFPEVVSVSRRTGRDELDEHAQGVEASELDVSIAMRDRGKADFLEALRASFSQVPGMNITIGQPISHRIDHMLSGTRANIAVKIFGADLYQLRSLAEASRQAMQGVAGVVDLSVEQQTEVLLLAGLTLAHGPNAHADTNRLENLTLDQALEMAERRHPQLAEARALVEAAAGRAQQAGAFPNPEAIVGAQQIPLDRGASNQREYVAGVAQPIPLGGRLGKAREAELLEREVRVRGLETTRRDLRRRVHGTFATALYQEKAFQTQSQISKSVANLAATTKARVDAGDAVPEDLAGIEMELARAGVELQRGETMRGQAMLELQTAMGDPALAVHSLAGSLDATFEIPTLESLAANLSAHPEALQAEASLRASAARIDLAEAERIPDVKVEALYHRLEATKENTFDIGLSIPLPLFNRNQGRRRETRAEVSAAEARSRSTQNELTLRLREAHAQLTGALATSRAFQSEILPRADIVLKSAEARFAAGDISLGEVVPVRRDWAAVQLTYLESLREVMQAWVQVRSLARSE